TPAQGARTRPWRTASGDGGYVQRCEEDQSAGAVVRRLYFPPTNAFVTSSRPFSTASRIVVPLALWRTSATIAPFESLARISSPTPGLAIQPPQNRAPPCGSHALKTLPSTTSSPPDLTTLKPCFS